jgi:hypothetical protein
MWRVKGDRRVFRLNEIFHIGEYDIWFLLALDVVLELLCTSAVQRQP